MEPGYAGSATAAASCNNLVQDVAVRHPAALVALSRLMAHHISALVRPGPDDAAAVRATRAVFDEMWRLAPVSTRWHGDARSWLLATAHRRRAEQARPVDDRGPPASGQC
ncbi:hypothetical protein GCM10020218_096400 [Dactylosporangium vinaceum]